MVVDVEHPAVAVHTYNDAAVTNDIARRWQAGCNVSQIAEQIGESYWCTYSRVRRADMRRLRRLERSVKSEILRRVEDPSCVYNQVAKEFGVHRSTVLRIAQASARELESQIDNEELEVEFKTVKEYRCQDCERLVTAVPCVVCHARHR